MFLRRYSSARKYLRDGEYDGDGCVGRGGDVGGEDEAAYHPAPLLHGQLI
jgi:hypothetical protein